MRAATLMAMGVLMGTMVAPSVAEACGGCFIPAGSESTVVTSHRMAMSISQSQSVLWDQIQYAGNPEEFSWVLPVKPGSVLEVGSDAFFDVLEAGTSAAVGTASVQCSGGGSGWGGGSDGGFGCGSSDEASGAAFADGGGEFGPNQGSEPDPVTVVSQGTVGPYETVTLSTEEPGVLNDWLDSHGYAVPEDIEPIIDAYVEEGFDFIALRLVPGNDVQQMQPVRVVMPGSQLTLPLRLVAAGTGAQTALTLFVLSEGRYETQNFANVLAPRDEVVWDWATSSSNYAELRADALAQNGGANWMTSYAMKGSLFDEVLDGASEDGSPVRYTLAKGYGSATTIADSFIDLTEGYPECLDAFRAAAEQNLTVVDNCDDQGKCTELEKGQVSLSDFDCGPESDDLGVALTGMHLGDVWLTRLEADLPRAALDKDLILTASMDQTGVASRFMAPQTNGNPCPAGSSVVGAGLGGKPHRRFPGGIVALTLGALGLGLMLRRRRDYI